MMLYYYCLIIAILDLATGSLSSYGTISRAQLITNQVVSIWLYNQSSWSQCMCQAHQYKNTSFVAFNFFTTDKTCQLISNDNTSMGTFYIVSSSNSTIYILTNKFFDSLKSICCSDTLWLMNKIQQFDTFNSINITLPVGLGLDYDRNILILNYGSRRSIQQKEANKNMSFKKNLYTKTNAQPISYHDGMYYVGINPPAASSSYFFYGYNSSLTRIIDLPFPDGDAQRAVWLFNNSIMCIIVQRSINSTIDFLNWYPSTLNFTYNRTLLTPFDKPYGLAKANDDSMIYVSGDTATIYQLSTRTFIWSILVLNDNSAEMPMSLIVDSCGNRLWVLMLGFGIRIYDRINGNELVSWNMSTSYPTLYDMVLTSHYELYLIDYSMNELIHYGSPLKDECTIS